MPKGFIPLAKQLDFLWNEVQGKEQGGFGKFLTSGATSPADYATQWDKYYERSGGAGDAKARDYANSVYAAMAEGTSNEALISPNAKFSYDYLIDKGLTPQQASGVTGRMMAESYEDMNPDARNTLAGGKGSYGVAQWRGSRLNDLADFAGVNISDITSLPATTAGGGLLNTNRGSSTMINPIQAPLMGEILNPQAAQQAQRPQQGGLGGLLSTLKDKAMAVNPNTGLTGYQSFAAALDPLILPTLRGGGDVIRQQGAQRVAGGNKNKTIEMLRTRGREDLADMVERGMISPTEAAGQLLTVPKAKGKTVDAAALRTMFPGAQIEDGLYNLKPDGTATKVGGGGVNVSLGGEGTEAFEKEFGKLDAKKLAEIDNIGSSAKRSLNQIGRLERILGNIETGMTANVKQIAGNLGIQTEGLDEIQAAAAIINALVPAQRPPGSGVMSDADLELFKQSLPRLLNSPGGNLIILETMRGLAQYDAMGSEIVQKFRSGDLTKVEAFSELNSRPDPFAKFNTLTGADEADMSAEEALKILK